MPHIISNSIINEKGSSPFGAVSSVPWLWVVPGLFSLLGLTGIGVSLQHRPERLPQPFSCFQPLSLAERIICCIGKG